jgi:hypothetical protein
MNHLTTTDQVKDAGYFYYFDVDSEYLEKSLLRRYLYPAHGTPKEKYTIGKYNSHLERQHFREMEAKFDKQDILKQLDEYFNIPEKLIKRKQKPYYQYSLIALTISNQLISYLEQKKIEQLDTKKLLRQRMRQLRKSRLHNIGYLINKKDEVSLSNLNAYEKEKKINSINSSISYQETMLGEDKKKLKLENIPEMEDIRKQVVNFLKILTRRSKGVSYDEGIRNFVTTTITHKDFNDLIKKVDVYPAVVYELKVKGSSLKEIAKLFGLSEGTIRGYYYAGKKLNQHERDYLVTFKHLIKK